MKIIRFALRVLTLSLFTMSLALIAQAQATRTWVSGVGDDANPCSRTAPCRTFAGAISKTAINGEIDVLDPGGHGAVTIIKSITIDAPQGMGYILASPGSGIVINATGAAGSDPLLVVRIRNIAINGTGGGTRQAPNGISILAANAVYIENCVLTDFTGRGISDTRLSGKLFVQDTITRNNGEVGIRIGPTAGTTTLVANLNRVTSEGNVYHGVASFGGARVTIRDSFLTGNDNSGLVVDSTVGSTRAVVENTNLSNNLSNGIFSGPGSSETRIANSTISNNANGVNVFAGTVYTWGNNHIKGNTSNDVVGSLTSLGGTQ